MGIADRLRAGQSRLDSARFEPGVEPPVDLLREWIDESYRAIAPKKLVAGLPPVGTLPVA